jgi:hypothetical protein
MELNERERFRRFLAGHEVASFAMADYAVRTVETAAAQLGGHLAEDEGHWVRLCQIGLTAFAQALDTYGGCHERDVETYVTTRVERAIQEYVRESESSEVAHSLGDLMTGIDLLVDAIEKRDAVDLHLLAPEASAASATARDKFMRVFCRGIIAQGLSERVREIAISMNDGKLLVSYLSCNGTTVVEQMPGDLHGPLVEQLKREVEEGKGRGDSGQVHIELQPNRAGAVRILFSPGLPSQDEAEGPAGEE